jgi:hypothetical protein
MLRFYSCCTIGGATNSQRARTLNGKSTKKYLGIEKEGAQYAIPTRE